MDWPWKKKTFYEEEIERLQGELQYWKEEEADAEYDAILAKLDKLHKLAEKKPFPVSADTLVKCVTYLLAVGAVIGVELKGGMIRSDGLKFFPPKP